MILSILEQGLIYGILALGLLITYRILDFPDLTVDSSFPLGAAVSAVLTLQGMPPWLTLLCALAVGYMLDKIHLPGGMMIGLSSSTRHTMIRTKAIGCCTGLNIAKMFALLIR